MTQRLPGSVPVGWQRRKRCIYKAGKSGGRTGLEGTHRSGACIQQPGGGQGGPNIMLMVGGGRGERRVELGGGTLETVRVSVSVSSVQSVRCGQKINKEEG